MILPKKNTIGIYKITSPSGRIYIGQSRDIRKRWNQYLLKSCLNKRKLHNSFIKYGVENHVFEIIEECLFKDLNIRERYWQEYYDVISEKGLNLILQNIDYKTKEYSKETRLKMSKNSTGKKMSKEAKDKLSKSLTGRKLPKEVIFKIKESMKGKKHSEETKRKISESEKIKIKAISPTGEILINGVSGLKKDINISTNTIYKIMKGGYSKKWKGWTFEYIDKERN